MAQQRADVLVLNASHEVLHRIGWQDAVTLMVREVAEVHEVVEGRFVRSQFVTLPLPAAIRLRAYVYIPHAPEMREAATRRGVLARDRATCAYCGDAATTVDHVLPRSRGGRDTWENLVACCRDCNAVKADRTPEEAGMRLRWAPRVPNPRARDQRRVWRGMRDGAAA